MSGKYRLCTLGCKVNQYESQQIRELVEARGFRPAMPGERHDLAVVNTCAVTADASRKNRQAIRRASNDGMTPVIVVGCGASADAEGLRRINGVIAVLGHDADIGAEFSRLLKTRLERPSAGSPEPTHLATETAGEPRESGGHEVWMIPGTRLRQSDAPKRQRPDSPRGIISSPLPVVKTPEALFGRIESFRGHQRAFLKIQDGCDAHCTYCIIPQLRRTLRAKPVEVAVAEARALVRSGHREIVVTGIFLGAYGRPTAIRRRFTGEPPLARLVAALAEVEGLERLRLSSLEPGDVDDALLEILATRPACVPHLHLPLQSGSPEILRRMNRQYTAEAFKDMVDRVRERLDAPAISTDIIVGFPGETDADFEATVRMARYAGFSHVHAFPFSPRSGTAAAKWQRQFVARDVVRERVRTLARVEAECSLAYRRSLLGRTERIIVEKTASAGREGEEPGILVGPACGRADRYFEVWFDAATPVNPGDVHRVRLDRVTPSRTHGTLLPDGGSHYPLFVLSNVDTATPLAESA